MVMISRPPNPGAQFAANVGNALLSGNQPSPEQLAAFNQLTPLQQHQFGGAVNSVQGRLTPQQAPPTGLIGSEQALQQAQTSATGFIDQGLQGLDPFAQGGSQAADIQAALSGALGPEAQRNALATNLEPVSQFLQDRGEQTLLRNAAATGGVGGGNLSKDLVRFGQGLAGETAQQQFENLGRVADRGFSASKDILSGRGRQADITSQFGLNRAAGRTRAGEQLAGAVGGTTSALSQLINQQGQGLSGIIGDRTGNLANILAGTGTQQATTNQQLAQLLANLASQSGGQIAGLPGIPGTQQTSGILGGIGSLASGAGTLIGALNPTTGQQQPVPVG